MQTNANVSHPHGKVSVIIPCFNNEDFIEQAMLSALNQSYAHYEVIVIDDGSTDGSLDIIRSFGDRIRCETGSNRGAPAARNRGLGLAQGEFVKFLDADDLLLPDCLDRQVSQAQALPAGQKAIVYGDALWIDRQGQPLPGYPIQPRQPGEDPVAHILAQNPLTSCPLHRKAYLQEVGGFDPALPRGQEFDLHLRLVLAGVEFVHRPGPVYQYRDYSDAQRISNQGYSRHGPLAYYEVLQKQQQLIELKKGRPLPDAVRQLMARRFWMYGRGVLREGYGPEAKRYFTAARQLDPVHCIVGNAPYPAFVRLFGPQYAEKLMHILHRLLGRKPA